MKVLSLFFLLSLLSLLSLVVLGLVSRQKLTPAGPEVSRIQLGTLNIPLSIGGPTVATIIRTAFDQGITTFDLAVVYDRGGAREVFGQAVALLQQSDSQFRSKIEVIAKMGLVWKDDQVVIDTSIDGLNGQLDDYLNQVPGGYVDFVMLHSQDDEMDVQGVAQLWCSWRSAGKARYFGVSNHDNTAFVNFDAALKANCGTGLVTNQIEVSTLYPALNTYGQPGGFPLTDYHYLNGEMSVLAWGPEGGHPYGIGNRLFGDAGTPEDQVKAAKIRPVLQSLAIALNATEDQVELAFLLKYPANIVPIIGSNKPARVILQAQSELVAARMTIDQWQEIATAADAHGTVPWPPPSFLEY